MENKKMKNSLSALSLIAMLALTGCESNSIDNGNNTYNDQKDLYITSNDGNYYLTYGCTGNALEIKFNGKANIYDVDGNFFAYFGKVNGEYKEDYIVPEQLVPLSSVAKVNEISEENWNFLKEDSLERNQWLDKNIKYPVSYTIGTKEIKYRNMKFYTSKNEITGEVNYFIGYDYDWVDSEKLGIFDIATLDTYSSSFMNIESEYVNVDTSELTRIECIDLLDVYKNEKTSEKKNALK